MHVHQWETRTWRHLDSCQFKTLDSSATCPIVLCPEHGSQTVAVPWAEKYGRFSKLFERLAIDVLRECSVSAACELLRISWDEADGIKQRAVARGLLRKQAQPVTRLGVDEKSAGRGQNYVTVVARLEPGQAGDGGIRGGWAQTGGLGSIIGSSVPVEHRAAVEAVAMDLWEPYFNSTVAHVPEAADKIVHDPYHLGRMLSEAVDKVRRSRASGSDGSGRRAAGRDQVRVALWLGEPAGKRNRNGSMNCEVSGLKPVGRGRSRRCFGTSVPRVQQRKGVAGRNLPAPIVAFQSSGGPWRGAGRMVVEWQWPAMPPVPARAALR